VTCIVGVAGHVGAPKEAVVYIGGDSAGVDGLDLVVRADAKVFVSGPYAFGFCGSFRMGQLLRYSFKPPRPVMKRQMDRFMATTFLDAVRDCLRKGGYLHVKDNVEGAENTGAFLVGVRGQLFVIEADMQVGMAQDDYIAIGCGAQIAHGSLFTTRGKPPRERVNIALNAAERHSAGVRRPFVIVRVGS
jgi:hypothetical protein